MHKLRKEVKSTKAFPNLRPLAEKIVIVAALGLVGCGGTISGNVTVNQAGDKQFSQYQSPNEGEITLTRRGNVLEAEVHQIQDINCGENGSCSVRDTVVKEPNLVFQIYDSESGSFKPIEGCEGSTCDVSEIQ